MVKSESDLWVVVEQTISLTVGQYGQQGYIYFNGATLASVPICLLVAGSIPAASSNVNVLALGALWLLDFHISLKFT